MPDVQPPPEQQTRGPLIAIDGPSGSGKSSTARGVAVRLGLAYLDTGAMYRAIAIAYRDAGLGPHQVDETTRLARDAQLLISTDPERPEVLLEGRDVTDAIRDPQVSATVSQVATMVPVREVLRERQRAAIAAAGRRMVVEGRDITTVVAPDADLRILLRADPAARMARREAELGGAISHSQAQDQVLRRDRDDATVSQFETPAPGVIVVDSTRLTLDEVIDTICSLARQE